MRAQINTRGCSEQLMCAAEGLCEGPARFFLLNHPSQPDRTSPNPAQMRFTAQCRSASSRVHLSFIYKEPRIRSMPPHTHWKHSHRDKNTRVAGCTASSERSRDASCWMLLCICLGLIPQASRLLLFWASAQLTRGRRSLTLLWCSIRQRVNLLNRFFWLIRSKRFHRRLFTQNWFKIFSRYESFRIKVKYWVKLKLNKIVLKE